MRKKLRPLFIKTIQYNNNNPGIHHRPIRVYTTTRILIHLLILMSSCFNIHSLYTYDQEENDHKRLQIVQHSFAVVVVVVLLSLDVR